MTTRWDLVAEVADRLERAGVPTPDVDARWLVEAMVDRFGPDLASCDAGVLDALVERRAARVPLQLVLGHTTFRWVELACRDGVFVPRPETEVVAGVAIEAARAAGDAPRVVEPCTGTGAIALAVASEVPGARVAASDRSDAAVALARENLATLRRVAAPQPWRPGPWLAPDAEVTIRQAEATVAVPGPWRGVVDVVVCNPPYLPARDTGTWPPEVGEHDPHDALVGGPDGHEVVDALLAAAPTWLRPGGTVVVEIDDRRGPDAVARARAAGLVDVRLVPDLTGRDRAVTGRTPTEDEEQRPDE